MTKSPQHHSPWGVWRAGACSPAYFIMTLYNAYWDDLWAFIRGLTSSYKIYKALWSIKMASGGPWMPLIRPKRTEPPSICSPTCTKQQANRDKRCPKNTLEVYWVISQNFKKNSKLFCNFRQNLTKELKLKS